MTNDATNRVDPTGLSDILSLVPNNGTGGDLLGQMDRSYAARQQMIAAGRTPPPTVLGSVPVYGNGNQNAAEAAADAGRTIVRMQVDTLTNLAMLPLPGVRLAAAMAFGGNLIVGDYAKDGTALAMPVLSRGLSAGAGFVSKRLTAPGTCTIWERIRSLLFNTCFAAGTPLLTPEGSKPIEQFAVGDLLLARRVRSRGAGAGEGRRGGVRPHRAGVAPTRRRAGHQDDAGAPVL